MTDEEIARRIREIEASTDPADRSIMAAVLVGRAFREEGHKMVLVGGSAVEFYTDGLYVSGDVDICYFGLSSHEVTQRIMERLGPRTTGRHYNLGGCFVEILGPIESHARTEYFRLADKDGTDAIYIDILEEVIAERVYRAATDKRDKDVDCAMKLLGVCIGDKRKVDWEEVRRLLRSNLYGTEPALDELIGRAKTQLGI